MPKELDSSKAGPGAAPCLLSECTGNRRAFALQQGDQLPGPGPHGYLLAFVSFPLSQRGAAAAHGPTHPTPLPKDENPRPSRGAHCGE